MQELRAFLELEGPLADNYQWRQLHPMQGSLMEGLSRLPKQLLGAWHTHGTTSACGHAESYLKLVSGGVHALEEIFSMLHLMVMKAQSAVWCSSPTAHACHERYVLLCGVRCDWHAWATGQEGTIAAPAEAAQSTKNTSDLLRRWKEYATSFKVARLCLLGGLATCVITIVSNSCTSARACLSQARLAVKLTRPAAASRLYSIKRSVRQAALRLLREISKPIFWRQNLCGERASTGHGWPLHRVAGVNVAQYNKLHRQSWKLVVGSRCFDIAGWPEGRAAAAHRG